MVARLEVPFEVLSDEHMDFARALRLPTPAYFHCELMRDSAGVRLAKRHDALSLRALREQGWTPARILASFAEAGSMR